MINRTNNRVSSIEHRVSRPGFSLTEVLIAIGMLAVGMLFIAGAFPVSIHFTTVATERTIAATVADEAFVKLRLHGPGFNSPGFLISDAEFAYPSTPTDPNSKQYWWSYIYSEADQNDVIVFVFRKAGVSTQYWIRTSKADPTLRWSLYPTMIYVGVGPSPSSRADELMIRNLDLVSGINEATFINAGYTIVDADSGRIYRVLERYQDDLSTPAVDESRIIRLERDWIGPFSSDPKVWVASPSVNGGRYPCIGVFRKDLRF